MRDGDNVRKSLDSAFSATTASHNDGVDSSSGESYPPLPDIYGVISGAPIPSYDASLTDSQVALEDTQNLKDDSQGGGKRENKEKEEKKEKNEEE